MDKLLYSVLRNQPKYLLQLVVEPSETNSILFAGLAIKSLWIILKKLTGYNPIGTGEEGGPLRHAGAQGARVV